MLGEINYCVGLPVNENFVEIDQVFIVITIIIIIIIIIICILRPIKPRTHTKKKQTTAYKVPYCGEFENCRQE